jgi:hypothetical protein
MVGSVAGMSLGAQRLRASGVARLFNGRVATGTTGTMSGHYYCSRGQLEWWGGQGRDRGGAGRGTGSSTRTIIVLSSPSPSPSPSLSSFYMARLKPSKRFNGYSYGQLSFMPLIVSHLSGSSFHLTSFLLCRTLRIRAFNFNGPTWRLVPVSLHD